jgi:signal transduction histidine kinase
MQGFGSLLLSDSGDRLTPESAHYLRRIMEAARRMDALILDSLQYAKIVRDQIPLGPVEPAPVLRGILESYPTFQRPRVEVQIIEPLPPVIANEAGLLQCFSNLLANAIKFVEPGKVRQVRVWAELREEAPALQQSNNPTIRQSSAACFVRFWIGDNGIGISPEHQERIFDMFQQLDRSYEGTGIGLALVRKVAERMGGKVGVESQPGNGSRFWLEFKKANPPVESSADPL